jgi:peptidoglycan LD-endopeptidase CwlK
MKKEFISILCILLFICTTAFADENDDAAKAMRYIKAYPEFFTAYKDGYLITKDGSKVLFDDGEQKNYDRMITNKSVGDDAFDPKDSFHWDYPAGTELPTCENPPEGDPGRIRPSAIFQYMYGSSKSDHVKKLRCIEWVGSIKGKPKKITVTTVNGVDKALEEVAREIKNLPDDMKKNLNRVVFNVRGPYGFFERPVRDYEHRVSGHAYGIAVDINGNLGYFIGGHKGEPYQYRNNVPRVLVDIFEKNGFIWGGRWHDYDIMHFEYRPELLIPDKKEAHPERNLEEVSHGSGSSDTAMTGRVEIHQVHHAQ